MALTLSSILGHKCRPWSPVSLVTLACILSIGCATSSSHFQATHIHLSNMEAQPALLDAPLFRDNAVAVDPKSLHVVSEVISPAQEVDGSSQSSKGSPTIKRENLSPDQGKLKNLNAQSNELSEHSESSFMESVQGTSFKESDVGSEGRILSVDDMEPSESTAVEFFRSALESLSPFRGSGSSDLSPRNGTSKKDKADELPIEEFKINMADVPSLDDLRKASKTRAKEKTEAPIESDTKRKRQRFFNQSPLSPQTVYHRQPPVRSPKTRQRQSQQFMSVVRTPIEATPNNVHVNLQPQAMHFTNFRTHNAPEGTAIVPYQSSSAGAPVYRTATGEHLVPYATFSIQKATNPEMSDKTPVYRVRKSTSRRPPITNKRSQKTKAPRTNSAPQVHIAPNFGDASGLYPGVQPYASDLTKTQDVLTPPARGIGVSGFRNGYVESTGLNGVHLGDFNAPQATAAYSAVQPSIQRANTPPPLYRADISTGNAQTLPYSGAHHPRREFSETLNYPAYPSLNSVAYSDPTHSSLLYQSLVPAYTHHFQVHTNPYIPVVSLKDIYPNALNQPSSSSLSTTWPNEKPSYQETPPFLRDLANSFETGPVISSVELSKSPSSSPKPSKEKEEFPTIINHIHITERRRPGVDREFTIDSGSGGTEWVIHKSDPKISDSSVGSVAKIRRPSRKESGGNDGEEFDALTKVLSKEKRGPKYVSKREYLRSAHPLMIGHRLTQALRVADDHRVPEFYLKPVKARVSSDVRSVEKKDDAVANNNGGFFSTIMKFFGQSDSQLEKSESVEIERHSYKDYKPMYRDRFEELIANLDNDSFDAFLTAIKVNQIFDKSFKRLKKHKGLLNSSTLFSRRSNGNPKENTEELADRMVEDFVSVLFEEYPTIAHQVELNKPFVSPPESIHRDQFIHPQERRNRDNMMEYIGLHNFTENLNDFSNKYSGKTRKWADYMSHLLTEQYFRSVDVSQPVRENLDRMVNSIKNEDSIDTENYKESFPRSHSRLNIHEKHSEYPRQNYEKNKPELLSGEVKVELGYNGTSGSVLHNMLSDILGNFIDFGGATEASAHESVPSTSPVSFKSNNADNRQSPTLDDQSYKGHAHEACYGLNCLQTKSNAPSPYRNKQTSSPTEDDHSVLLDRLSWIFKEDPEQLQAKVMDYIHQKYNSSGDENKDLRKSNFGYIGLLKENEFDSFDENDKFLLDANSDQFKGHEKDLTKIAPKDIDLLLAYLAQAYPYFWANIIGLYPGVQPYASDLTKNQDVLSPLAGGVRVSGLRNGYVGSTGLNGIHLGDFNAVSPGRYDGDGIHGGARLRNFQATRAPTRHHSAYESSFNLGSGLGHQGLGLGHQGLGSVHQGIGLGHQDLNSGHQGSGGRLNPSSMHGWVRPNQPFSAVYPMMNTGRVHSLTHAGLQRDPKPVSGIGYWRGNRGSQHPVKLEARLRDMRRKKMKASRGTHASSSFFESLEPNSSYDDYGDYEYGDYEIEIRSEILRPGDDPTKGSNFVPNKNHKDDASERRNRHKQKRKYKVEYDMSAQEEDSEDYYENYSTEARKTKRKWSNEATHEVTADEDSEGKISLIQEPGKTRKQSRKRNTSYKIISPSKKFSNKVLRSNKSNSSEVIDKNFPQDSNDDSSDSRVIINIGYPFPSTESSTASSIPDKSDEEVEEPESPLGFLSSLRYLFNSYVKNSGEQTNEDNSESKQAIERESKDAERSSEAKVAFSHVDPETHIHTIVTTSTHEEEDRRPSVEYRKTRKPPRLSPIRKKSSRVKNLARGQRRPALADSVFGGSTNVQRIAHTNLPKETKKLFPLVDFEEVSFTETFLGDSSETFQTPKPLDQFDLDPLNPMKPKMMSKMTDTVPKVMTQPGTIYFNGGPMVRYQAGEENTGDGQD